MSSFNLSLSCVSDDGFVEALSMTVCGKADKEVIVLTFWADTQNPALCPVLHILVWISLTNIKSGYLFPDKQSLM
jgi:hypothetical protein